MPTAVAGGGQRRPGLPRHGRRHHDVRLERDQPDGDLPGDRRHRQLDLRAQQDGRRASPTSRPTTRRWPRRSPSERVVATTNAVTDYWAKEFGPYPFTSTGAIVDNLPDVGFSLETQTRPLYGFAPDPGTLSHELAHQWFGDSVSVRDLAGHLAQRGLRDLRHGPVGRAHRRGAEHLRRRSAGSGSRCRRAARSGSSRSPTRAANTMFSQAVYYRGGMTLEALRHRIGDADFFRLLQTWTKRPSLRQRRHRPVRRAGPAGLGPQPHGVLPDLALGQDQARDLRLSRRRLSRRSAARPGRASATASFCRNDAERHQRPRRRTSACCRSRS